MRTLFEMDKKDYSGCTHTFTRNSARSIIIRNVHYPISPEDVKEKGCDYVAALRKVNQSNEY